MLSSRRALFWFPAARLVASSTASALNPEHRIAIFRLHDERQLHHNFVHATDQRRSLFRRGLYGIQLGRQSSERVRKSHVLVAVLFEKVLPPLEGKAIIVFRQQRKKELRAIAQG